MKELSIEEKAKRYDEALVKAAKIHRNYKGRVRAVDVVIEEVFPELKESEGERIRKKICKLLWDNAPYEEAQEYITWLEKQGEQKATIEMKSAEESLVIDSNTYNKIVDECIYGEQKPDDVEEVNFFDDFRKTDSEVEPKFKVGDWVIDKQGIVHKIANVVENVTNYTYAYDIVGGGYFNDNTEGVRLWTIQDAKDGDVLVNQNGEMPFIFKECKNNHIYCYCGYTNRKDIFFDKFVDSEGEELHWLNLYHEQVYPATKEQRDLLFSKMKEAGYEWDTDKKELKKIEQKPAWSEEDERIYMSIMYSFAHNYPLTIQQQEFVKSIKERVQPQLQQGWTEEDERIIKRIDSLLYSINESEFEDIHAWFKFLKNRVQPKQEWSKEDEGYYDAIIAKLEVTREDALLTDNEMDFLKSLEGRVQLKQEWSEKDKHMLQKVIDFMNHPDLIKATPTLSKSTINWLEFLKERYTWKPSEEQMRVLDLAIRCGINRGTTEETTLVSLFNDLKKLI